MRTNDSRGTLRSRRLVMVQAMALTLAAACVVVLPADAYATRCSPETEQIRSEQEQYDGSILPDCRAYEQVSPTDKNLADASGRVGLVQSARLGDAVTYFSILPFPGIPGSSGFPIYLGTRGKEEWSTQGLRPATTPGPVGGGVVGWNEDLEDIVIEESDEAHAIELSAKGGREYVPLLGSGRGAGEAYLAGATPNGSSIVLEDEAALVKGAIEGEPNVYEWHDDHLSLIAKDAAAGPEGGARGKSYTENLISEDGSRIFFTSLESGRAGRVYMVEPQSGREIEVSKGPATWEAATSNGTAFYIEAGELYRFEVESGVVEPLASEVIGTLGVSENGSYVYFAKSPADLYMWHDGTTVPIAKVNGNTDRSDWYGACVCGGEGASTGAKSSRVAPDGQTVLFSSTEPLTGYDNAGHIELYLYHASTGTITCVSCNSLAATATSDAYLTHNNLQDAPLIRMTFLTRNLSANGQRVFFQTEEALVPADVNGQMNVYEWEQEGAGSCPVGSGGCISLISTGQSTSESYFGDASVEGEDVFFFTRQSLVAQDLDYNDDLYDARVEGGITAQNSLPEEPCASEEACAGPPAPAPAFTTPASAVFSGSGNLSSVSPAKPKVKKAASKSKKGRRKKSKRAKKGRSSRRSSARSKRRTA